MRPAQVVFGPLVARVMNGAAGRYTQFPNVLHRRNMITLKDHLVRTFSSLTSMKHGWLSFEFLVFRQSYSRRRGSKRHRQIDRRLSARAETRDAKGSSWKG